MKALSLWQPWASLLVHRFKLYETRGWDTPYRGWLAIHATSSLPPLREIPREVEQEALRLLHLPSLALLPRGRIVGLGYLDGTFPCAGLLDDPFITERERLFGGWLGPERVAWRFSVMHALRDPVPANGRQKLWPVPPDLEGKVRREYPEGPDHYP